MNPLVIIPARGGSKGLPGKNIKKLNGKPLIQYTIECAREVFDDEFIVVSTDALSIKKVVEKTGLKVPELRPSQLATDHASSQDVLLHCLERSISKGYQPDTIILLQVTSPFRSKKHLVEALDLFDSTCEMVASVKITDSNPYYVLLEEDNNGWLTKSKKGDFNRRQDCPDVYELNGAIYIIDAETLIKKPMIEFTRVRKYVMKAEHSVDIDNQFDWDIAEMMIEKGYVNHA